LNIPNINTNVEREIVQSMTNHMSYCGPDAEGLWTGEGTVLGHRLLGILGLYTRANQTMVSTDGRYAMVLNGDIYHSRDLRRELETTGASFRTTSDTEVVMTMYARVGEAEPLTLHRSVFAQIPSPGYVVNRSTSGLGIPTAQWLREASGQRPEIRPLGHESPCARHRARMILTGEGAIACA